MKIFILLYLFLGLCHAALADIKRDVAGNISRSAAQVRLFRAHNPCPATGKIQKSCPGYVVDHILPLCAYGIDSAENMQWQAKAESLKKDKLETRQCRAIKAAIKKTCQIGK